MIPYELRPSVFGLYVDPVDLGPYIFGPYEHGSYGFEALLICTLCNLALCIMSWILKCLYRDEFWELIIHLVAISCGHIVAVWVLRWLDPLTRRVPYGFGPCGCVRFVPYELMDLDTDYLFVWANWV